MASPWAKKMSLKVSLRFRTSMLLRGAAQRLIVKMMRTTRNWRPTMNLARGVKRQRATSDEQSEESSWR
jgi:hypothetical protein